MRRFNPRSLAAVLAAAAILGVGYAMPSFSAGPEGNFNIVHGVVELPATSGIVNTARTDGVASGADQTATGLAVSCTFNQASHSNSPSTTFAIQGKDVGSGTYYTLITSPAITADATPATISAGLGVATTANVGAGIPLPSIWRVTETIAGTTPVVTGTVRCRTHH